MPLQSVPVAVLAIKLIACGVHATTNKDTCRTDLAIIESVVLHSMLFRHACHLTALGGRSELVCRLLKPFNRRCLIQACQAEQHPFQQTSLCQAASVYLVPLLFSFHVFLVATASRHYWHAEM